MRGACLPIFFASHELLLPIGQRDEYLIIVRYSEPSDRKETPHRHLRCMCVPSHVWLFAIPTGCSPPGSSVLARIFQARILEWVAISYSSISSLPGDQTHVSCIGRWVLCWETQYLRCQTWKMAEHFHPKILILQGREKSAFQSDCPIRSPIEPKDWKNFPSAPLLESGFKSRSLSSWATCCFQEPSSSV